MKEGKGEGLAFGSIPPTHPFDNASAAIILSCGTTYALLHMYLPRTCQYTRARCCNHNVNWFVRARSKLAFKYRYDRQKTRRQYSVFFLCEFYAHSVHIYFCLKKVAFEQV